MKKFILLLLKYAFKLSFIILLVNQLIGITYEFLKFPTEINLDFSKENATDLPSFTLCLRRSIKWRFTGMGITSFGSLENSGTQMG
jgi:hypothetical protein